MSDIHGEQVKATWGDLFRDGRSVYTVSLVLGIVLHAMDAFVVATIMPSVVRDIGGTEFYAWVVMLYMTAAIVGAASGGPIKIMFGPRRGYATAGIVFLVGTVISASAPTMPVLLVGRLIQGFGAGMIVSQNVVLMSELFPPNLRTRMIAVTSAVWAIAALLGPLIGGIFAQLEWWRGAFWFAVPVILTFTAMAWRTLPDTRPAVPLPLSHFPIGRVGMLGVGVLAIGTTGNIEDIPVRVAAFAAGLAVVWLMVRLDARAKSRVFPSRPFSLSGPVGTAYWSFFLVSMAPLATGIFLPLAYQTIHGLPPIVAGYLGAALALSWSASSFIAAHLHGRGENAALVIGPAMAAAGLLGIATFIDGPSIIYIVGFTVLTGLGVGLCVSHLMNWTMLLAAPGEESITASSIHTVRSLGIAVGSAAAGLIANQAGLGGGISVTTVTSAVSWVTSLAALAPATAVILGFLLIWHRARHDETRLVTANVLKGDE